MPEALELIARLQDVAVMGPQRRGYLGIAKHSRPILETQVGGYHNTGVFVQLGEQVKQQGAANPPNRVSHLPTTRSG